MEVKCPADIVNPGRKWANLPEISPLILLFCEGT